MTQVNLSVYESLRDAPDQATADYLRCEVAGVSLRDRARERDVAPETVHANVKRARGYVDA